MELYHWLALAGGVLALLALVLALAMRNRAAVRIPAALAAALAAFVAGIGVGVVALTYFGYHWDKKENEPTSPAAVNPAGGGDPFLARVGMGGGGPPGGGRGRGAPGGGRGAPGGGRGGAAAPSPKAQLASLVDKLDLLTRKPLAVDLDKEKKKQVLEQLRGLGEKDDLKDEDAKAKLDALLEVLKGDRDALEAVGYRWPGAAPAGRGPGRGAAPANPFKQEDNGKHLKDLELRLEKGPAG
jgi:hypothetical protein